MTATVLPFRSTSRGPAPLIRTKLHAPRPRLVPAATPWWTCMYWCTNGQCYGGESFDFGHGTSRPTSRMHHGIILHEQIPDIDGGHADVRVELQCVEDPDDGYIDGVQVVIQADVATPDLDAAQRVADAIQAAIYHARQPLPSTRTAVTA